MTAPSYLHLCLTLLLTYAMYTTITFVAWRNYIRETYTLCWMLAFIAATMRWALECLGPQTVGQGVFDFSVEAFAIALITLASFGHCLRVNDRPTLVSLVTVNAIAMLALIYATLVNPHDGLREASTPAAAGLSAMLLALMVLRHRESGRHADLALGLILGLFALIEFASSAAAYGLGQEADPAALLAHTDRGMYTLPFAYIAIGTMVLFVFSSDLTGRLRGMAQRDQLTGLHNRHGSVELGDKAFEQARQTRRPLSVIVADIDHFKQVNDSFGHAGGDIVLESIAERFDQQRGGRNVVARLGGEEFLLILPNKPEPTAAEIAEALRTEIEDTPVTVGERSLSITASFGVASLLSDDRNIESLIARADRAMYRSKYQGRNRVSVAKTSDETFSPLTSSPLESTEDVIDDTAA